MSVSSANSRRPYRPLPAPAASDSNDPPRTLFSVTSADGATDRDAAADRATQNLRRHAWRAVRRVSALLGVDATGFLAVRAITQWGTEASPHVDAAGLLASSVSAAGANELSLAVALLVGTTVSGTYGPGDAHRSPGRLCVAAAIAAALPLWALLWSEPAVGAQASALLFALLFGALITLRSAFVAIDHRLTRGTGALARTVLIGPARECLAWRERAALSRPLGYDVIGFIDVGAKAHRDALGTLADLERILGERRVDTVVLCGLPTLADANRVLRAAAVAECSVLASAPQLELPPVRPNLITEGGQPLIQLRPVVLRAEQLLAKRAMDIIGATIALILLAPVMAIVAMLVVLDSHGPVVFAQRRLGRFGRPIRCYKFRSMYVDAEARLLRDPALFRQYVENDYKLPASVDARITRVGRFLRRTSLDELPQLWNVLKGEMSLVGPRPIVPDEIHHYNGEGPLLLSLKPGITGAWQVSGRSALPYPKRATVELAYVEGWSLWRDLGILLRTVPAVVAARGAH